MNYSIGNMNHFRMLIPKCVVIFREILCIYTEFHQRKKEKKGRTFIWNFIRFSTDLVIDFSETFGEVPTNFINMWLLIAKFNASVQKFELSSIHFRKMFDDL